MEFRFRTADPRPRRSPSSASGDSSSSRLPHQPDGYFGTAQGMLDPFRGGRPPPPLPPFLWEAAERERIIRQEVERRLIEVEVRRELEAGLHSGGFGPFFAPDCFMPPPPMPMHPPLHAPPPVPFGELGGPWQGFGQFGPPGHAGFGQRMLLPAEEMRWSPPPKPKRKLELREIEPSANSKVLSSERKVSKLKKKADAITATIEPRKIQKPRQNWSCALCKVSTTSEARLNDHLGGKKHKLRLTQRGAVNTTEDNKSSSQGATGNKKYRRSNDDKNSLQEITGNKNGTRANADKSSLHEITGNKNGTGANDDKSSLQETTGNENDESPSDAPKKICIQVDRSMYEVIQKDNYLWCECCRIRCGSNITMAAHLRGKKHSESNKVWSSIKAVRMNIKTKEGTASPCNGKVNENSSIETPAIIKEETCTGIEVGKNGPVVNPVEIKKEAQN